jgi:hypothetical protein
LKFPNITEKGIINIMPVTTTMNIPMPVYDSIELKQKTRTLLPLAGAYDGAKRR